MGLFYSLLYIASNLFPQCIGWTEIKIARIYFTKYGAFLWNVNNFIIGRYLENFFQWILIKRGLVNIILKGKENYFFYCIYMKFLFFVDFIRYNSEQANPRPSSI